MSAAVSGNFRNRLIAVALRASYAAAGKLSVASLAANVLAAFVAVAVALIVSSQAGNAAVVERTAAVPVFDRGAFLAFITVLPA